MCLHKTDINPIFNSPRCKFTSTKSKALHFINYQLISRSKTAIGERTASALERYVCLILLMKMIVLSVCLRLTLVSFAVVCASACWRNTHLLICGDACCISAVISECHIAYNTLSHVYYFYILGGVKFTYVVSTTRCIYTCPVSSGMWPRPPPEVFWAIEVTRCKQPPYIFSCYFSLKRSCLVDCV